MKIDARLLERAGLVLCLALVLPARALASDDSQRQAKFALSYGLEARRDLRGAIRAIEDLEEDDYLVELRLGWLNYRNEAFKTSADHYSRAARLALGAVEPLLGMMLPLQAAGLIDAALQAGNSALRLDPCNYTALSRMAGIHYSRKDYSLLPYKSSRSLPNGYGDAPWAGLVAQAAWRQGRVPPRFPQGPCPEPWQPQGFCRAQIAYWSPGSMRVRASARRKNSRNAFSPGTAEQPRHTPGPA